jgi:hypothetical protein
MDEKIRITSDDMLEAMKEEIYAARDSYNSAVVDFLGEFLATAKDLEKAIGEISARDAFLALMLHVPKVMENVAMRRRWNDS